MTSALSPTFRRFLVVTLVSLQMMIALNYQPIVSAQPTPIEDLYAQYMSLCFPDSSNYDQVACDAWWASLTTEEQDLLIAALLDGTDPTFTLPSELFDALVIVPEEYTPAGTHGICYGTPQLKIEQSNWPAGTQWRLTFWHEWCLNSANTKIATGRRSFLVPYSVGIWGWQGETGGWRTNAANGSWTQVRRGGYFRACLGVSPLSVCNNCYPELISSGTATGHYTIDVWNRNCSGYV